MRRFTLTATAVLLLVTISAAQKSTTSAKAPEPSKISTFDLGAMDKSVDPCTDFYQYACGTWRAKNPVPSDQPIWGRFNELGENNRLILRSILENASTTSANRSAVDQKIGDYYAACMDETAIEQKGTAPLKPELDRIAALKSKADLPAYLAKGHQNGIDAFFNFKSEPDAKNAKMVIAATDQGGIGLPERDYYFKDDPKSVDLRSKYLQHVQNMFQLLGDSTESAAAKAKTVMAIETALAKASLDNVSRRDPNKLYHKMSIKELVVLSPAFDWNKYIANTSSPTFDAINVYVPDFVKGMNEVVANNSLQDVKTYLTWNLLQTAARMLPDKFVQENFNFNGRILTGAKEIRPRWKRCVSYTDNDLGEALGQAFVDRTFGTEGKQRTLAMVQGLEKALERDIKDLPWMTGETKKQASVKLQAIANKIGYPEKWRDYSLLNVVPNDALGNSLRANAFETQRQLKKIGKPVDRTEWEMSPPTVNAYYNPQENNINFPAGILQPPFFDKSGDEAANYGGIGAVIGHELTHGFDDEGRQFDADGNLRDWWTEKDATAFNERAQCIVDQYNGYTAVDDVKLNGKLTLGENTADNGGVKIAYMALMDRLGPDAEKAMDSFTPAQRFFIGYSQVWCQNETPEFARMLAQVDPHSPGKYRVNGTVSNMPEFQKAFNCKAGAPLVRKNACRVW
ncbi:MAG TPA: M13 family metallopeptidase [Clostridia bacterium]|nr:M13 family metallopeptidase [Clostridia bacterium]